MPVVFAAKEHTCLGQTIDNQRVCVPDTHPMEPIGRSCIESPILLDRAIDGQSLLHSREVVIGSVSRCGVNETGPVFQGYIIGFHERALFLF